MSRKRYASTGGLFLSALNTSLPTIGTLDMTCLGLPNLSVFAFRIWLTGEHPMSQSFSRRCRAVRETVSWRIQIVF
jgi:hypothetical protein